MKLENMSAENIFTKLIPASEILEELTEFSIVGFFCVIFSYPGVNLLLSGLHSYGSV